MYKIERPPLKKLIQIFYPRFTSTQQRGIFSAIVCAVLHWLSLIMMPPSSLTCRGIAPPITRSRYKPTEANRRDSAHGTPRVNRGIIGEALLSNHFLPRCCCCEETREPAIKIKNAVAFSTLLSLRQLARNTLFRPRICGPSRSWLYPLRAAPSERFPKTPGIGSLIFCFAGYRPSPVFLFPRVTTLRGGGGEDLFGTREVAPRAHSEVPPPPRHSFFCKQSASSILPQGTSSSGC